jgi:hypothetical protein
MMHRVWTSMLEPYREVEIYSLGATAPRAWGMLSSGGACMYILLSPIFYSHSPGMHTFY